MKKFILAITAILGAATFGNSANLDVTSGAYSWSGSFRTMSTASQCYMKPSGLGYGSYRYGYLRGNIANRSSYRSGSVVGALWVSPYIGASSGWITFAANWGGNPSSVFNAYESWTCTKYGYRKRLNRSGYSSLAAHEYTGSWPMRDELYFRSSYGSW